MFVLFHDYHLQLDSYFSLKLIIKFLLKLKSDYIFGCKDLYQFCENTFMKP